jgi:hypothetical protein
MNHLVERRVDLYLAIIASGATHQVYMEVLALWHFSDPRRTRGHCPGHRNVGESWAARMALTESHSSVPGS